MVSIASTAHTDVYHSYILEQTEAITRQYYIPTWNALKLHVAIMVWGRYCLAVGFYSQKTSGENFGFIVVHPNTLLNQRSSCQWHETPWCSCDVNVIIGGHVCSVVADRRLTFAYNPPCVPATDTSKFNKATNGLISEIPQCTCPISHNAPLWNRNVRISVPMWCIVGYGTGALWDFWIWSIPFTTFSIQYKYRLKRKEK